MKTMNISRNPDWENAQKRLEAFWQNEIIDRPCIQIYAPAPKEDYDEVDFIKDCDKEALWNDPETVFRNFRAGYMRTRYMGENLPVLYPKWPGVELMMGSDALYDIGTIWIKPNVETILDLDVDQVSMEHPIVQALLNRVSYCAEHGKGEAFVGMPSMCVPGDTIAAACGYGNLLVDLMENKEEIMIAEAKLTVLWKKLYDALYDAVDQHMKGSCSWLPAWYPGRGALLEFDMAAMVSPEMFHWYLPFLLERAEHVEKTIYHLDGPDALVHLDALLAQKEIHAIQWEPGVASENILDWIPVMQKIQAAGKGLYVAGPRYKPEAVLELLKHLKPEGLILPVSVSSVEEGERFLETVEKMY